MNFEQAAKQFGITTFDGLTYALTESVWIDDAVRAHAIDKDGNEYLATWDVLRLKDDDGQDLELDEVNYTIADDMRQI